MQGFNLNSGLFIINMITQKTFSLEGKDYILNCSDLQCNWVLIYNTNTLLFITDVSNKKGILETCNSIFEASTKEECLAEVKRLNLNIVDKDIAAELKLLELPVDSLESKSETISIFDLFKLSA